ncbi:hypothetical protein N0B51_02170 [Tsuneonella sp. YG55]|uniref:Uncharacterized protein n=1 Tax=Tsuneonella litorea TaxID=2976475 RepID=A0A9X2VZ21_9SPHN|nr:hypothetical protein [Tsuneonella litorea]MCT2557781.1 hypothetical protein [Tsuneonella litorea]
MSTVPHVKDFDATLRTAALSAIAATAIAIGGCSRPAESRTAADILGADSPVSEAEMRAARMLSLGNNGAVQAITDPFQLSVSCVVSLEWLGQRMREGGMTNADQNASLDKAIKIYRARALDGGNAPVAISRALETRRSEDVGDSQQAKLAMACLRQLAQPAQTSPAAPTRMRDEGSSETLQEPQGG